MASAAVKLVPPAAAGAAAAKPKRASPAADLATGPKTLTERQLAWLRREVKGFAEAHDAVKASDAWAARVAARIGAPVRSGGS